MLGMKKILRLKEERFCQAYAKSRNGAGSYFEAYDCDPETHPQIWANEASLLLQRPEIQHRLMELTEASSVAAQFGLPEMIRMYAEMASADANELIRLRMGCCRYCLGAGHRYQWREREFLEACDAIEWHNRRHPKDAKLLPDIGGGFGFNHTLDASPDCPECRGEGVERVVPLDTTKLSPGARMLYGGVKKTRGGGLEIIIADQSKARESLGKLLGLWVERVRMDGSISASAELVEAIKGMSATDAAKAYQDFIAGNMAVK